MSPSTRRPRRHGAARLAAWCALAGALTACGPVEPTAVADPAGATPTTVATATPPATKAAPAPRKPSPKPSAAATRAAATSAPAPRPALLAVVGITDGDTIRVRVGGVTERVRVIGIDTPELAGRECYAQQAASRMQSLVQSRSVRLVADRTQDDRDRYGRLLRHVHLADGRSVARLLIEGGYGREYTYDRAYQGRSAHLSAQAAAKQARRGLWGSCAAGTPAPLTTPAPGSPSGSSSCLIKGNISSEGEKIYHVPGQQYYDVTKISTSKGERWFCREADAVAAGWRRSQR